MTTLDSIDQDFTAHQEHCAACRSDGPEACQLGAGLLVQFQKIVAARLALVEFFISCNRVSRELANHYVARLSDVEVLAEFELRAGMELSAARSTTQSGQRRFYPVSASRDDDGRPGGPQPHS